MRLSILLRSILPILLLANAGAVLAWPVAGTVDTSFVVDDGGLPGDVEAIVVQNDGKILIGGYFSRINGVAINNLARLNSDGSVDTTFYPGAGPNHTVKTIAIQNDGKILIGGWFSQFDGSNRAHYARLNGDGSRDIWAPVGDVFDGNVNVIVIQPDGKTIIAGDFTTFRGVSSSRNHIVRLNADGTVDGSFKTGLGVDAGSIMAVTLQPDGKILVGGYFTKFHKTTINSLVRLNKDGTVDAGFNNGGFGSDGTIHAIALNKLFPADGKITIGGYFSSYNGTSVNALARLNSDGSLDNSFSHIFSPAGCTVTSMVDQADGRRIITGNFNDVDGLSIYYGFERFENDGSIDLNFYGSTGPNGGNITSAALQPNGDALLGVFNNGLVVRILGGDADGDGWDDSVDAFPANDAAAFDLDRDGIPDGWLQPNPYGCLVTDASCNGLTITQDPPNVIYPLNAAYKGASIHEFTGWQD